MANQAVRPWGDGPFTKRGTPRQRTHLRGASLAERLEAYSIPEPTSGCVLWIGATSRGYGHLRDGDGFVQAHRAAYELARGSIPDGLHLDHLCRNPGCINPAHLEPVTPQENTLRGVGICAKNSQKRVCVRGHRLSGKNVRMERGGRRRCKECQRLRKHFDRERGELVPASERKLRSHHNRDSEEAA